MVLSERDARFQSVFQCSQVPLGQLVGCGGDRRSVNTLVRVASPAFKRSCEDLIGSVGMGVQQKSGFVGLGLEHFGVQFSRLHVQAVASGQSLESISAERSAKIRHVNVKRVGSLRQRRPGPDLFDEPVGRHYPIGSSQQDGQHRLLAWPTKRHRLTITDDGYRA